MRSMSFTIWGMGITPSVSAARAGKMKAVCCVVGIALEKSHDVIHRGKGAHQL